jgi:hypothetical protein
MGNQCEAIGRTGKRCRHPKYHGTDLPLCAWHAGLRGPALREYTNHLKMVRQLARIINRPASQPAEASLVEAIQRALLRPH